MIGHGAAATVTLRVEHSRTSVSFFTAQAADGPCPVRGIVTLLIQTVGICKGGSGHAQLRRLAVHLRTKRSRPPQWSARAAPHRCRSQSSSPYRSSSPSPGRRASDTWRSLRHVVRVTVTISPDRHAPAPQGCHQLGVLAMSICGRDSFRTGPPVSPSMRMAAVRKYPPPTPWAGTAVRLPSLPSGFACTQNHPLPQVILFYSVRSSLFPLFSCR